MLVYALPICYSLCNACNVYLSFADHNVTVMNPTESKIKNRGSILNIGTK